jgi:hypothetical protein
MTRRRAPVMMPAITRCADIREHPLETCAAIMVRMTLVDHKKQPLLLQNCSVYQKEPAVQDAQ